MPAALASHISIRDERALMRWAEDRGILVVDEAAISSFEAGAADLLREQRGQNSPLPKPNVRVAIFRPEDGGTEHFALIIHPDDGGEIETPPLVRIHSQCITGDILGSLKCDCVTVARSHPPDGVCTWRYPCLSGAGRP